MEDACCLSQGSLRSFSVRCKLSVLLLIVKLGSVSASTHRHNHRFLVPDLHEDGLGAQLQPKLSCIMQANTKQFMTYAHVPFKSIAHGLDAAECEAWFNLGEGEVALSSLPKQLPHGIMIDHVESCNDWADRNPHFWSLMKTGLRKKYYSQAATPKPITPQFKFRAVNVAVHVRRGDVLGACNVEMKHEDVRHERSRCMPQAYIASVMHQVAAKLSAMTSLPINIQVFTEGEHESEVAELKAVGPNVEINLGGNVLHVFHALASADVLIMAHSSFSLTAALYGAQGQLVIFDQFWHNGIPSWIRVKNGTVGGRGWAWHEEYVFKQAVAKAEKRSTSTSKMGRSELGGPHSLHAPSRLNQAAPSAA